MLFSRTLLLTLSIVAILPACAKKKESSSSETNTVYKIPSDSLSSSQEMARNATVSCSGTGECSPSVGLLSIASPDSAGQCSASLIGDDIVVTNSHCIADDLKSTGSSCRDRLWLNFASDSSHPEYDSRIGCDKVLYSSPETGEPSSPDYAYIKLQKKSNRPTLRFSRSGFSDQESYFVHKVNPIRFPGRISGSQTSAPCKAVYGSMMLESFFHSQAKVALLTECEVIKGNSGGPVLAADGTVRGVIFAYMETDRAYDRFSKNSAITLEGRFVRMNLASNFACLQEFDDATGTRLPGQCSNLSQIESAKQESEKLATGRQMDESFQREVTALPEAMFRDFKWTADLTGTGANLVIRPLPSCVKAGVLNSYLGRSHSLSRPRFKIAVQIDRYMRERAGMKRTDFTYDVLTLTGASGGKYNARLSGSETKEVEIPLCQ